MFEFYDDNYTIDEALKFQKDKYFIKEVDKFILNKELMEEYRKELLTKITGGSEQQFKNCVLVDSVRYIYCEDGFIYTSKDGKNLLCTGCIAESNNYFETQNFVEMICIADKIGDRAFAIDDSAPVTRFVNLYLPFLKPQGLPPHSMHFQTANVYCDNLTAQEICDALDY